MPDTGAFDLHAIDQIEWSPAALALGYRAATQYFPTEAGARKLILMDRDEDRLRDFAFTLPCERQIRIGDVADREALGQPSRLAERVATATGVKVCPCPQSTPAKPVTSNRA